MDNNLVEGFVNMAAGLEKGGPGSGRKPSGQVAAESASTMDEHDRAAMYHRDKAKELDTQDRTEAADLHANAANQHQRAAEMIEQGAYRAEDSGVAREASAKARDFENSAGGSNKLPHLEIQPGIPTAVRNKSVAGVTLYKASDPDPVLEKSNPEGINQYTAGGGGKAAESASDAESHLAAADYHTNISKQHDAASVIATRHADFERNKDGGDINNIKQFTDEARQHEDARGAHKYAAECHDRATYFHQAGSSDKMKTQHDIQATEASHAANKLESN